MSIISMDLGTSTTKIIEYENNKIINRKITEDKSYQSIFEKFVRENNIKLNNIEKIVVTGVGASKVSKQINNIPVIKVDEFLSIGKGGVELSKKEKAIVVSVGTGTAFVRVDENDIKHIGGTGVGAGTLVNLCNKFINVKSFDEIMNLAMNGNLSKIDLKIGDVSDSEIQTLPKDITAVNFGKLEKDANSSDIVLGFVNMIFETIGMMAVFCTRNDTIKDIVITGNIAEIPRVKEILDKIECLYNIEFEIPENQQFATAVGAIKNI